jgi:hypothetical protein
LISWEVGLPSRNPCDAKNSKPHPYRRQLQAPTSQAKKPCYNKAYVDKHAAAEESIEMPAFLVKVMVSIVMWSPRMKQEMDAAYHDKSLEPLISLRIANNC